MANEMTRAGHAGRALIVSDALAQEGEQRKLLGQYVNEHMQEGTDYGIIPGTERKEGPTPKTLLKPGAEKLTQLFRCIPQYTLAEKIEDWDKELFYYRFQCSIVTQADGAVVAEGVGSCSTYESRYRWRNADRSCPECGKATVKRSRQPPRNDPHGVPGWYCFAKIGGCGANFDAADQSIVGQPIGRVKNPDLLDCVNTVLKIAKKRALVDAAIALARCSDIFTQDLDDLGADHGEQPPAPSARPQQPQPQRPEPARQTPPAGQAAPPKPPAPAAAPAPAPKPADPPPAPKPALDAARAKISATIRDEYAAKIRAARTKPELIPAADGLDAMTALMLPDDVNKLKDIYSAKLAEFKEAEALEPVGAA